MYLEMTFDVFLTHFFTQVTVQFLIDQLVKTSTTSFLRLRGRFQVATQTQSCKLSSIIVHVLIKVGKQVETSIQLYTQNQGYGQGAVVFFIFRLTSFDRNFPTFSPAICLVLKSQKSTSPSSYAFPDLKML